MATVTGNTVHLDALSVIAWGVTRQNPFFLADIASKNFTCAGALLARYSFRHLTK
jgi:hypothetical protein